MTYQNFILSAIAVLLALHLLVQLKPSRAVADGYTKVDIVRVGGRMIYGGRVPVGVK
jgi:hypothetical protein